MTDKDRLVTVANASSPMYAQMLRLALERAGIAVFVQNENTSSAHPHYAHIVGIDIQVAGADLERARRIVWEAQKSEPGNDIPPCPACGSENTGLAGLMHRWGLLVALSVIFMQFFPPLRNRLCCRDCGHRWVATGE